MITPETETGDDSALAAPPCATCGRPRSDRFCGRCGERALEPNELSVRRFIRDALTTITEVDGRLPRTVWLLVRHPGLLTAEFVRGRRVPYLRPIQLFLLANLVYFFVQPLTGYTGYSTTLESQMNRQFYSEAVGIRSIVERDAAREGIELERYEERYDRRVRVLARSMVFIMVPLLALLLAAVLAWRKLPFGHHLAFGTHFYAFELLFVDSAFIIVWSALLEFLAGVVGINIYDLQRHSGPAGLIGVAMVEFPTFFIVLPYLYFAVRRAYALRRPAGLLTAATAGIALFPIILFYRLMLFWLTFMTI